MRLLPSLLLLVSTAATAWGLGCSTFPNLSAISSSLASNSSVSVEPQLGGYLFRPTTGPNVVSGGPNVTRGLFWIPDAEIAGEAYAPYCRRVAESGYLVFLLTDALCLGKVARHTLFAAKIQQVMTEEDLLYWAVAGHGQGAELAVQQLQVYHPRIHGLILLQPQTDTVDVSDKRTATYIVNFPNRDQSHFDNHTYFQTVVNSTRGDFAFTIPSTTQKDSTYAQVSGIIPSVMSLLHFPSHMAEVWATSGWTYDVFQKWYVVGNPSTAKTGLVFYVGAAIPESAYLPWASQVAAKGYLVILPKFALNLPLLDPFVADRVIAAYPGVAKWAVSGHSLGSVAIGIYLTLRAPGLAPPPLAQPKLRGVIFQAGVLTVNLTTTTLKFAQIYGTLDIPSSGDPDLRFRTILLSRLPAFDGTFPLFDRIVGGNHGYMGWYDEPHQVGDGVATISRETQDAHIVETTVRTLSAL